MDAALKADAVAAVRRRYRAAWLLPFLPALIELVYRLVVAWLEQKSAYERERVFLANREAMRSDPL